MSFHAKIYTSMKLKVEMLVNDKKGIDTFIKEVEPSSAKFDAQQEILNYTLHAADLSHNAKSFRLTEKWTTLVMNEFWDQGDLEKKEGLTVSFNCDRTTANVPRDQIGFLNGIIIPTFSLLVVMFPKVEFFVDNARGNSEEWNKKLK
jgi:hypothetical protein